MAVKLNKTITVTGASVFMKDEKEVQVAYMNATIQVDGKFTINKAIQDKALFEANREEALKDFAAFEEYIYNLSTADEGGQ